jgi:hypothetical protein
MLVLSVVVPVKLESMVVSVVTSVAASVAFTETEGIKHNMPAIISRHIHLAILFGAKKLF